MVLLAAMLPAPAERRRKRKALTLYGVGAFFSYFVPESSGTAEIDSPPRGETSKPAEIDSPPRGETSN